MAENEWECDWCENTYHEYFDDMRSRSITDSDGNDVLICEGCHRKHRS